MRVVTYFAQTMFTECFCQNCGINKHFFILELNDAHLGKFDYAICRQFNQHYLGNNGKLVKVLDN